MVKTSPCEPLKSAFRWAKEAQGTRVCLLNAPGENARCLSEKQPSSRSSVPEVVAEFFLSFSDFWSRGAGVASAALSGDVERLMDIKSDDCSIVIQRLGVEEPNLPDILEHWTLREHVEMALLRAA